MYIKNKYWELYNSETESDSNILSASPKSFSSSMLTQIRVSSEENADFVHFKIAKKFSKSKKNNTLKLTIETIDNKVYYFSKDIVFNKEGWQGATGLNYNLVIDQCDKNGVEIDDLNTYPLISLSNNN